MNVCVKYRLYMCEISFMYVTAIMAAATTDIAGAPNVNLWKISVRKTI